MTEKKSQFRLALLSGGHASERSRANLPRDRATLADQDKRPRRAAPGRARRAETHEVAVALGSTLASTFLSEPPRMAAHAPRPVRPYTPRAMYSLALSSVQLVSIFAIVFGSSSERQVLAPRGRG